MTGPSRIASEFQPVAGASYKLIYLARRHPGMIATAFPGAWADHSRLASSFATSLGSHFLSVRQCVKDDVPGINRLFANDYDGSSILAMRSWPDLLAARYHPHALDELLEDEKRVFAGAVDDWTMAVEEHVIRAGSTQHHVLLSFLAPDASIDAATFAALCGDHAHALARTAPSAPRIVWNRVVDPARAYPFAAIVETWFGDRAEMDATARTPGLIAALAQRDIADPARSVHLYARLNLAKAVAGAADGTASWTPA